MANRRKFTAQFKKKVVLEALKERQTLANLAQKHDVHPSQITTWKNHFIDNASLIFEKDTSKKDKAVQDHTDALLRTIGQLKVENDFLKKNLM